MLYVLNKEFKDGRLAALEISGLLEVEHNGNKTNGHAVGAIYGM